MYFNNIWQNDQLMKSDSVKMNYHYKKKILNKNEVL